MTNPAREAKGSVVDDELLASIRRVFRDHHDEEFFFGLGRFISAYADAEGAALAVARKLSGTSSERRARIRLGGMRLSDISERVHKLIALSDADQRARMTSPPVCINSTFSPTREPSSFTARLSRTRAANSGSQTSPSLNP